MEIDKIFMEDFQAIQRAIRAQLVTFHEEVRAQVLCELGIDEATDEALRLENEIKTKQLELQRLRERLSREIYMAEQRLELVKSESLGAFNGPPEPEQLQELGFNHDTPVNNRTWYGFPVRTKLEAMVCLKLKKTADVETPLTAVEKIAKSVQREMAFVSTFDDAERVYEKFYSLNFRQYGVDIPPRLDDLKKLKGQKLLKMDVVEKNPPKQLVAASK
jgi:hypothetical protein